MFNLENLGLSNEGKRCLTDYLYYVNDKLHFDCVLMKRLGLWPREQALPVTAPSESLRYDLLLNVRAIEIMLDKGHAEELFQFTFPTYVKKRIRYARITSKQDVITTEFFEQWLRVHVARDKLLLSEMGLLKRIDGSLKKAQYEKNSVERMFKMIRYQIPRTSPEVISIVREEAAKMDSKFFARMAETLERSGRGMGVQKIGTRLENFLLDYWIQGFPTTDGGFLPPLCAFSNPALNTFVNWLLNRGSDGSTDGVRKTYQRLGLKRIREEIKTCRHFVDEEGKHHVTLSQFRPNYRGKSIRVTVAIKPGQ